VYLKSLEIQGFKSFADKTVLSFDDDITAIVGPNGSGKSNLSDAIRWVMGEQSSKSLRGAKMEDVIFGGTQKRGQLGFAEVSLILDNSDGELRYDGAEVMVTRRYYRSGESEYYINKQSARLRDINELFMDTGLGREGYSNIGQGRIDEILSLRSTDRREIFEEAAGISKFRHRKEETERRLAATEDNLTRIGDKISELELQVEPLRRQAEQAKKYLELRDELRGLEVTVWLDSLQHLSETAEKAAKDFEASAKELEQAHGDLTASYQQAEQLSLQLHTSDLQVEGVRERIAASEAEEQRCIGEKTILENNLNNNEENVARIRAELDEQQSRTGGLSEQIEQGRARINEILQDMGALQERLKQALQDDSGLNESSDELTAQLLEKRAQQAELLNLSAGCKAEGASANQLASELSSRISQLKTDRDAAAVRLSELQQQFDDANRQLKAAQQEVVATQNRIEGYSLRVESRTKKRDSVAAQLQDLQVRYNTAESKIRMYREMEREYEGYSRAVREVMKEAERGGLRNIHGPVSRLIHTETRYATAVETALGASMQNIVVSTEEDGSRGIDYLKRRDIGRATFMPITAIRGNTLQEKGLESCRGYLGLGSELVEFDSQYRAIVTYLLGRTAVVDRMDNAIAIFKKYSHRFRIVTLDGQVLNSGGSMTGGSVSKNAGFLSRDNALRELTAEVQKLETQLTDLTAQHQQAQRLAAEAEFEMTAAQEQLREAEDTVLRAEGTCKQYDAILSAARDAAEGSQAEEQILLERLNEVDARKRELDAQQSEYDAKQLELEHQIQSLTDRQSELSEKTQELTERITQLRMQSAALDAERMAGDESLAQLSALRESLQGENSQRSALLSQYERDADLIREQIEKTSEAILVAQTHTNLLREELTSVLDARREVEAAKTAAEKRSQDMNKNILLLERETARLEQKKVTSELEQNQIIDRLWDAYGLTNSTAQPLRVEIESTTDANRKISSLKHRISALGTPNLGAIDEFARVSERYEYLTGQRDDVLTSRRDLESIIESITGEMTSIFVTQFARIDEYFGKTFSEMFGGGRASLHLEDPEHPLECGIEIRVQPPGKQLKTITLLSGGEKAFVAIALYFAILRVRPTPFCMLDEIDAALDERNVTRFAEYLRNLCDKTQFIVITHRRGTMEACDVLYGVTMQEQGVSRIIGINLNEIQEELGIE